MEAWLGARALSSAAARAAVRGGQIPSRVEYQVDGAEGAVVLESVELGDDADETVWHWYELGAV